MCCAGVWVTRAPRTCTIRLIHAPQGPRRSMGISDRHILVPYLWIRPISSWVRFGVKNQKKVDNAVVFGLRGMHNHTHLGHVMGYVVIGDVFRWPGAFFGVRGPPDADPQRGVREPVFSLRTIPLRELINTDSFRKTSRHIFFFRYLAYPGFFIKSR